MPPCSLDVDKAARRGQLRVRRVMRPALLLRLVLLPPPLLLATDVRMVL
jgi:hypothetical protein